MSKNKKGQTQLLGMLLVVFAVIVVGLALLVPVFNTQAQMTDKQNAVDETTNLTSVGCYTAGGQVNESVAACNITVNGAPTGWKVTQCPLTNVVVTNNTGTVLTAETDYNVFASTGVIQMLNTSDTDSTSTGQNVKVDYTYCMDGYNVDSGSRSIARLIGLFTALALMAFTFFGVRQWLNK